jgi:predicted dehydrogenase
MDKINWGIIGCGDVTEVKSGPAFNKVRDSALVAVMRRDEAKVKDYASRHQVPAWYTDAQVLINDPGINAIYVATPPSTHEEYTIAALKAGKPVYVEKPMSVDTASAKRMAQVAGETNVKLVVAHYRRAQPLYQKIKALLDEKRIGQVRMIRSDIWKRALSKEELAVPKTAWRVDPAISGGGLFHDLSPHQLDLMYYYFGEAAEITGVAVNQSENYHADDIVAGTILFKSGVVFNGLWCFNLGSAEEKDHCEIIGDRGSIGFSFFSQGPIIVTSDGNTEQFNFEPLRHVQQPMIERVVDYFLGRGDNPCSGEEGVKVMEMIGKIIVNK